MVTSAMAQPMLFDVPTTDRSAYYIGSIIGDVDGLPISDSTNSAVVGKLLEVFNRILFTMAVIVLVYTLVVSVLNTAQEGEILGKKWSTIWVPTRAAVGLFLMVPIPRDSELIGAGFNYIQYFVLWLVMQGVGAANALWSQVLDSWITDGSFHNDTSQVDIQDSYATIKQLLASTHCMRLMNANIDAGRVLSDNYVSMWRDPTGRYINFGFAPIADFIQRPQDQYATVKNALTNALANIQDLENRLALATDPNEIASLQAQLTDARIALAPLEDLERELRASLLQNALNEQAIDLQRQIDAKTSALNSLNANSPEYEQTQNDLNALQDQLDQLPNVDINNLDAQQALLDEAYPELFVIPQTPEYASPARQEAAQAELEQVNGAFDDIIDNYQQVLDERRARYEAINDIRAENGQSTYSQEQIDDLNYLPDDMSDREQIQSFNNQVLQLQQEALTTNARKEYLETVTQLYPQIDAKTAELNQLSQNLRLAQYLSERATPGSDTQARLDAQANIMREQIGVLQQDVNSLTNDVNTAEQSYNDTIARYQEQVQEAVDEAKDTARENAEDIDLPDGFNEENP